MLYGWELLTDEEEELIKRGLRDGDIFGGPFHLTLFPTDRCNLDCFFCYTETLRQAALELDWDILRRCLEEGVAMGVKGVSFGGGGESMIYGALPALLELLENHRLKVDSVKTNGTAITRAVADSLMRLGMSRVTISLNETSPDAYAKMNRVPPRLFDKALEGIQNLVSAKTTTQCPCEISIQVFIWKENFQRMPQMAESLLKTGADFVYLNTIDMLPQDQRMNEAQREACKEPLRETIERWASRLQLNFSFEGLSDFAYIEQHRLAPQNVELPDMTGAPQRIEYCLIGWHGPTIAASGDVFPCCHFTTDPARTLGNLHQLSLREIWYGERARQYRNEMRHLFLTEAHRRLLPRKACFIHPLCLERAACAFNYYLAAPDVYWDLHRWAEGGPRNKAKVQAAIQAGIHKILKTGRRLTRTLTSSSQADPNRKDRESVAPASKHVKRE